VSPCRPGRWARALVLLLPVLTAAPVLAQPAQPLSLLDVPFIAQTEALCGGAAAAMVLRFWGERGLRAESFEHLVDRSAAGIRTTALVGDLRARGWRVTAVEGDAGLIDRELARGVPVITLIEDRRDTYHYVVIVASTERAVVLHDPARAPFRVMSRDAFGRRWAAAGRWMAVILPAAARAGVASPETPRVTTGGTCEALVAEGVRLAAADEFEAAERSLTAALSCGGSAPLRELAGLRLLQRRWPEVSDLAGEAVTLDPGDAHAWDLLATSRFVQDDPRGALEAWNRIDRPRVDLVAVEGLARTRQQPVERLLGVPPDELLTPELFARAARRLGELPSSVATRLELVPAAPALAELRAHVVERRAVPAGASSYAVIGLEAAANGEVRVPFGSLTGGGERIDVAWRYWPDRSRLGVDLEAPASWGGLWGVDAFTERQPFTAPEIEPAERTGVGLTASNWVRSWLRVSARGGLDRWSGLGRFGVASGTAHVSSGARRIEATVEGSVWSGAAAFGVVSARGHLRTSARQEGRVLVARVGAALGSAGTPADLWFGGDTGRARDALLRAHPVTDGGALRADRIGRRILHASLEGEQWLRAAWPVRVGGAVFVDAAAVGDGLFQGTRGELDAGVGLRLGLPGVEGAFRVDVARGLGDGASAVSFVYEP
jgi:hypothetical protein